MPTYLLKPFRLVIFRNQLFPLCYRCRPSRRWMALMVINEFQLPAFPELTRRIGVKFRPSAPLAPQGAHGDTTPPYALQAQFPNLHLEPFFIGLSPEGLEHLDGERWRPPVCVIASNHSPTGRRRRRAPAGHSLMAASRDRLCRVRCGSALHKSCRRSPQQQPAISGACAAGNRRIFWLGRGRWQRYRLCRSRAGVDARP